MKQIVTAFFFAVFSLLAQAQNKGLPDFTELVEKQGPAVVNISTTQVIRGNGRGVQPFPFDENDPMFEFFRRFIPRQPGMPGTPGIPGAPREFESHSLGSGFIISADGYILTNAHVVDSADEILVRLTDKREFKAKVIGADKRTDVALIKIEASALPAVRVGDPNILKVGEWVVAIGSPFGFDNSVTAGIVSAKGRSLPQENFVPFIQTDVAINPGNSGGPLFNMKGEVVGINSQIYSRTGGYMGISFAIPIDVAMDIQNQLQGQRQSQPRTDRRCHSGCHQGTGRVLRFEQSARRGRQCGREGRACRKGGGRTGRRHSQVRRQAGQLVQVICRAWSAPASRDREFPCRCGARVPPAI